MNSWSFTGNLGRDAERRTVDDSSIVSFSVAVKSGYGDRAATTWVKCNLFGKRGESLHQYLIKGQQVAIVGEVTNREWTDKEGAKRLSLEVRVTDIDLIGGKVDGSNAQPESQAPRPGPRPTASRGGFSQPDDDDIPF